MWVPVAHPQKHNAHTTARRWDFIILGFSTTTRTSQTKSLIPSASLLSLSLETWHIDPMTAIERARAQMKGLRCSFPPYYVAAMGADGEPVAALPGDMFSMLERGLAPAAGEIRVTLIRLRQTLRWSRAGMAAFLGVDRNRPAEPCGVCGASGSCTGRSNLRNA